MRLASLVLPVVFAFMTTDAFAGKHVVKFDSKKEMSGAKIALRDIHTTGLDGLQLCGGGVPRVHLPAFLPGLYHLAWL